MQRSLTYWRPRLICIVTPAEDGQTDGAHDINHLERVWAAARAILAAQPEADALVVMAACYLHDLVNLPKNHPERSQASRFSAREAVARLRGLRFPEERLADVAHAIEAHSHSAGIPAQTLEARIVQDADRLDALGAVGLARMFHISGQLGRALAHDTDPLAEARSLDDARYTLDHIEQKLLQLPKHMHTETGRKLAQARAAMLARFRDQFVSEWLGTDNEAGMPHA